MAIKGTKAKQEITQKILEIFPNSFTYEKEIRIPYVEDGAAGQIKVTLTAAKNMIDNGTSPISETTTSAPTASENIPTEPSDEEKERLKILLEKLGL